MPNCKKQKRVAPNEMPTTRISCGSCDYQLVLKRPALSFHFDATPLGCIGFHVPPEMAGMLNVQVIVGSTSPLELARRSKAQKAFNFCKAGVCPAPAPLPSIPTCLFLTIQRIQYPFSVQHVSPLETPNLSHERNITHSSCFCRGR